MLIAELRGIGRIELHRRDQLLQAIHVEGAGVLDEVPVHHRQRNRDVLRRLFDAPGGDDDAFGQSRRHQRQLDGGRLSVLERDLAHRGFEAVQRGLEAIRPGRQSIGAIAALLVADRVNRCGASCR